MPTMRSAPSALTVTLPWLLVACGGGKQATPSAQQAQATPEAAAPAAAAPEKTYKPGDVVAFDHWTMVVLRVQPKWESASQRATAGMRLVAVELRVTNSAPQARSAPVPFFCTMVESPGGEHLGMLIMGGATPRFEASNIPANQPRTGWSTFNVADRAGLLFQCEPGLAADASLPADAKLIWNLGL